MSEPSAVNTSAFGEFAEAAYCFAVLDFEHYSLTKAKVLCQIFWVFLQVFFLVCPFDFSSFNFFPKIGKTLFCRLSERDFRRNPFQKEKAAAEAPPPPSLIGQLSVISQIFSFYRKRQLKQLRSRWRTAERPKATSYCYRRSAETEHCIRRYRTCHRC